MRMLSMQRPALPSTGTRKHDADRPKTDYELTSKLQHSMGAVQWHNTRNETEDGRLSSPKAPR